MSENNNKKITIDISAATVIRVMLIIGIASLLLLVREIFLLIILSFVFATSVRPVVDYLGKYKVPRSVGIFIIYTTITMILFFIIKSIIPPIVEQVNDIASNKEYFINSYQNILETNPILNGEQVKNVMNDIFNSLDDVLTKSALSGALGVFSGVVGFLTVLVLSFYMLLQKQDFTRSIPKYFPKDTSDRLVRVYKDISKKMTHWFWGQIFIASIIGLFSYVGLTILGIDYALTLALIAGVTALVPIIGPFIGATIAILVALAISPAKALAVVILYVIIQLLESYFITPNVMKKTLGVSPAIVIISILIGGTLFGFIGIVLALPLAAIISVVIDELYLIGKESKDGN